MDTMPDATAGEWLKPLLDTVWHDMHSVVPRGFPAYARIFHPVTRDRPQGTGTWHGHPRMGVVALEEQQVRWSDIARTFGTKMHPLAQFHRLIGQEMSEQEIMDSEGWRYSEPETGNLAPDTLAAVAAWLCEHTSTPDDGVSAIWEGWGGLTSSAGYAMLTFSDDGRVLKDTSPLSTGEVGPGSGLLPAEVVNGEKLELPGRAYYLYKCAPQFYRQQSWVNQVPWHHSAQFPQSPSILWPADRSWAMVTEIDFDSTLVAGSHELVLDLVQDPAIEALPLNEGADLTWDADILNRPGQ
ncbi:hypothetical protein [Demequina aurantiaca]|uniref:hypothetical protein n=1 Tax=Demequina aurantiaca TaxID=676200 RepID=UPI000780F28E|nr:hypothetical protein [Demequina aurantiaca]